MTTAPRQLFADVIADLERSGLDKSDLHAMHLEPLTARQTLRVSNRYQFASYRIPYFDLNGREIDFFRLRTLDPRRGFGMDGAGKYWQPRKTLPQLYFPPYADWSKIARDASIPITLTEGEKKAVAACKASIITSALGGAWMFQSVKRGVQLLPEFDDIELRRRLIELAYDGDQQSNRDVRDAALTLAQRLTDREAEVTNVILPPGMKLDDFLLKEGRDAYLRLPREPINPKVQISLIRSRGKLSPHARKERIADICQRSLLAHGTPHKIGEEPVLFHQHERRLYSFLARDDSRLRALFSEQFGVNPSEDEFAFAFEQVRGHIITHGAPTQAATFAHFDRDHAELQIYLGGRQVFLVTPDGNERVLNGHEGVLFRQQDTVPVKPAKKAPEKAFRYVLDIPNFQGGERLNVEQQQLLYELHFWSLPFTSFMPTRPLLLIHGVKGATKTSSVKAIGLALFGEAFAVQPVNPARLDDLEIALINNPLVALDNLDGRIPGLENKLAIASTGGQFPRRVLYTTSTEIKLPIRARVMATSRQPSVFVRDDVRDRTIFLQVQRRETFVPEGEINERVLAERPQFWAYVLARLPDIVSALANHKRHAHPWRMADFAQFCLAAGPAVGYSVADVEDALEALEGERNEFASSRSALLDGLQQWAAGEWSDEWKQSPTKRHFAKVTSGELFEAVQNSWRRGLFPIHTREAFGMALRNDEVMLADYFEITRSRGHARQTVLTIRPKYSHEMTAKGHGGGGGGARG